MKEMLEALRANGTHRDAVALTAGMRQAELMPNSRREAATSAMGAATAAVPATEQAAVASDHRARPKRSTLQQAYELSLHL
jgi:hypothetical protein